MHPLNSSNVLLNDIINGKIIYKQNLTFVEQYDHKALEYILNPAVWNVVSNYLISKKSEQIKQFISNLDDDPFDGLTPGEIVINYKYGKHDKYHLERIYCVGSASLQSFCRPIRAILSNACESLKSYVLNRNDNIQLLINANKNTPNKLIRDDVKQIYLSCMNGGRSAYRKVWNKTDHLKNFVIEMDDICIALKNIYSDVYNYVDDKPTQKYSVNGSFISTICMRVENYIIQLIINYARDNHILMENTAVPCFDGIQFMKKNWINKENLLLSIENMEKYIYEIIGIPISLKPKPFDTDIIDVLSLNMVEPIINNNNNNNANDVYDEKQVEYDAMEPYTDGDITYTQCINDDDEIEVYVEAIPKYIESFRAGYDTLMIRSPMGTGKTQEMYSLIRNPSYYDKKILIISFRRSLCREYYNELIDDNFRYYEDIPFYDINSTQCPKLIVQINSL